MTFSVMMGSGSIASASAAGGTALGRQQQHASTSSRPVVRGATSNNSSFASGEGVRRLKQRPNLRVSTVGARVTVRPQAGVFKASPPGSPVGSDSPSFRLDELGSSRARRSNEKAPRRRRVADLLDGPSRRTGRRGGGSSSSSSSSSSSALKDARVPLLGMLDDLGDRVSSGSKSSGRMTRGSTVGAMGAVGAVGAVGGAGSAVGAGAEAAFGAMAALSDVFEAPGRRVRRSDKTRAVRAAAKKRGRSPASMSSSAAAAPEVRKDSLVLGLLSGPSDRVSRATRSAKRAAARAVNAPLLGILSGPGKRTGRKARGDDDSTVAKV